MKVLAITKNPSKQNRENSPLKEQEGNLHILKKKCLNVRNHLSLEKVGSNSICTLIFEKPE